MTIIENKYYLELMFILLNIFQRQKLMKKVILTDTLLLKKKDKKRQRKKLNCDFIRINTTRKNYDAIYGAGKINTFISKFKDKENENKIKGKDKEI